MELQKHIYGINMPPTKAVFLYRDTLDDDFLDRLSGTELFGINYWDDCLIYSVTYIKNFLSDPEDDTNESVRDMFKGFLTIIPEDTEIIVIY